MWSLSHDVHLVQYACNPALHCVLSQCRSGEEQSHGASAVSNDSRSQDDDNLSGSWLVDHEADANEPGTSHAQHKSYNRW